MRTRSLDHKLGRLARRHRAGTPAELLADLCAPGPAIAEGLAAAFVLRQQRRAAAMTALAAPVALAVGNGLKIAVQRPRPPATRLGRNGRRSFPSTHLAGPFALLCCLWWTAPRKPLWRSVLVLGGVLVASVSAERVCAGAHWPSDVMAGALLGGLVGSALGAAAIPKAVPA